MVGEHIVARDEHELPDEGEASVSIGERSRDLRLRKIMDYIQEQTRVSFAEIYEYLNKMRKKPLLKRVVGYDLTTLRLLDIIELEDGKYSPKVTVLKFSEGDLELALKHSRKLLLPLTASSENRRFWLATLFEYLEAEPPNPDDVTCLLQHLKSGYYREIYERMLEYQKMADETGLSKSNADSLLGRTDDLNDIRVNSEAPVSRGMSELAPVLTVETESLEKLMDLRGLIIGKLSSIEFSLQHRVPLKGRCDYCPHLEISITD